MDALYIPPDALINTQRIRINTLALGARLPTMYGIRDYVEAGGLMSYGTNFPDCSGAPVTMSTRFYVGQSRPTYRSSSRLSSISSSILRPPRPSTSKSRSRSCCAPTRSSNELPWALRTRMDETGVSLIPKGFRIEFLGRRRELSCGSVRIGRPDPWLGRPEGEPVTAPTG